MKITVEGEDCKIKLFDFKSGNVPRLRCVAQIAPTSSNTYQSHRDLGSLV